MQRILTFSLLALIVGFIAGCGESKDVVAKVGREAVTLEDFKTAFLQKYRTEENAAKRSFNERKDVVRDMAIEEAKYQEALARGYDKDPALEEQLASVAGRLSLDYLYRDKVTNKVITDEAVKDYYDKSAKEMRARHILVKAQPGDTTDEAETRLKTKIDSINTLITNGMSFEEAAARFSEDGTTSADSGDLEWFPWGRMVDEFQQAVWAAKVGDTVGPVRTPFGYHLIKITDSREVGNRAPLKDLRQQIEAQLMNMQAQKMGETARDFVESTKEAAHVSYDQAVLKELRERLQDPAVPQNQELDPVFTSEQKAKVAATYDGGSVTVGDLIRKIGPNAHRVDWSDPQVALDLVNSLIEPELLEAIAAKEGYLKEAKQDPAYISQKRNAMVLRLQKEEVTDKVNPTEAAEKAYYEANLDQFIMPEQRTIREIFIKEDSSKAVRVRERALKGENFQRLAWQFNEKESTKADTGRIGPFERKRFGLIGKTAFRLEEVGAISEVVEIGKNYSVVRLLEILPSRTKTWEESSTEAKRLYRVTETDRLEKALNDMLLEKYPLEIFEDKLAAAWPLQEEEPLAREP